MKNYSAFQARKAHESLSEQGSQSKIEFYLMQTAVKEPIKIKRPSRARDWVLDPVLLRLIYQTKLRFC